MMQKIGPIISDKAEKFIREHFSNLNAGAVYVLDAFPDLYARTLHDLKGKFSRGELMLILDVTNGLALNPGLAGQHLLVQVSDGIELDGLDKKWKVTKKNVTSNLQSLNTFQIACLEIWAGAFWEKEDHGNIEEYVKRLAK